MLVNAFRGMLLLGLGFSGVASAAAQPNDEVAQYVNAEMQRQKIPGLALLVARDGKPVLVEGYGLANVELSVPVKPETLFQSGSVGKQMWTVTPLRNGAPNSGHYGLGWFVESRSGHHVVEHEGQWQGFETQISRYLDDGLTVVVLTNLGSAAPQKIADHVAAIYLHNKVAQGIPGSPLQDGAVTGGF